MKLIKEIKSKKGVVHFKRWRILTTPWFDVNIHGIYMADKDEHLHSHPWNIWTMVLWGGYNELHQNGISSRTLFNMSYRDTSEYHKIERMISKCFTLDIMSKRKSDGNEWGYLVDGKHVQHEEYRKLIK